MMGMKPRTALYCAAMGLEPRKPRRGVVAKHMCVINYINISNSACNSLYLLI